MVELTSIRECVISSTVPPSRTAPFLTVRVVVTVTDVLAVEFSTLTAPPDDDAVVAVTSASPEVASPRALRPLRPVKDPSGVVPGAVRSWTRVKVPTPVLAVRSMPS